MRENGVISVIGKEEKQTLQCCSHSNIFFHRRFPCSDRQTCCPLPSSNQTLMIILTTSICKKPARKRLSIHYNQWEKEQRKAKAGVKQLRHINCLALVQTYSGFLWSETYLRLFNFKTVWFSHTPPFFLHTIHRGKNMEPTANSNISILFLPLNQLQC